MDVFLTREARADLEALGILRLARGTWGFLLGHERGFRFYVEKAYPVGSSGVPSAVRVDELGRLWEGKVIGVFAFHPAAAFKKDLLGPAFFGKLYLEIETTGGRTQIKPSIVEYDGKFRLSSISMESIPKERGRD